MGKFESTDNAKIRSYIDTHSVDGGERGTERGVHTLPNTRQTAGPGNCGGGAGTVEGPGGTRKSVWPGEEPCGLCTTEYCRHD